MSNYMRIAVMLTVALLATQTAFADVAADANAALSSLYAKTPAAKAISDKSTAILVFPTITRAGLMVGGAYGEGVMMRGGKVVGRYNSVAGSFGLQAGVQKFGYALFLMNDKAIQYLNSSDGWEIGVGPTIVVVDEGKARTLTTTTLKDDVYAFIFDQKGLMAGLGIQGSKITKLNK
jgi:lipid-binding SYLF domain-containing protein